MNKKAVYLALLFWCVLVLWMTTLGYGSDGDAWRVARNAQSIWTTGQYTVSRTTGFPLFELLTTPLVMIGKWYLSNMIAVISGITSILAFLRLAHKNHLRNPTLAVIGFAFLPVFTASASSTMDYIPALALLLWAYLTMLERRWIWAAVLIGAACGFRLTSGLFVIPVAVYAFLETRQLAVMFKVAAVAFVCGILAYSPVLINYGILLPGYEGRYGIETRMLVTGYNLVMVFGVVQTIAICIALASPFRGWIRSRLSDTILTFHFVNIAVWVLFFLLMGDEPEYLMPAIPSIVLALDRTLSRSLFGAVVALLLSYSIVQFDVLGGESGKRSVRPEIRSGFTVIDVRDRMFKLSTRSAATKYVAPESTVLMYGKSWIPVSNEQWVFDKKYDMYRQRDGRLFVADRILDLNRLRELSDSGFRLVVWRGEKWEYVRTNMTGWQDYVETADDLSDFFGVELRGRASNQR
jgi:hypothetical protein